MTWRDSLRPKSLAVDTAVVGGLLVALNLIFDRAHAGWLNFSPSPFLLVPILLGGRYGFTAGVIVGLLTSAVVALLELTAGAPSVREAIGDTPYTHAAFVFAGGVCGELFGWFRRERAQTDAQLEKLQTSVRRLDADVRHLRGIKDELDRVVAARDGEVSALDTELRRLYACSAEDLPAEILQFLKRQVRLADAAIYFPTAPDQPFLRHGLVGSPTHLPESLDPSASDVTRLALKRHSLVTLPELLAHGQPTATERILLAAPLADATGGVRALLVVTGLPFIAFNAQTANLIELICDWAGEVLDLASSAEGRYRLVQLRGGVQRVFTRAHFQHLLTLAFQAHERHRLPSSIVVFSLPKALAAEQVRFESVLLSAVRAGDYAADLGRGEPHLAVLLPLVGERGSKIFVERCRQFLKNGGPWPVEVSVRRIELGLSEDVAALLAAVDERDPR